MEARPAEAGVATGAVCAAVLVAEVVGIAAMCSAVPLAWLWIGGNVYTATSSLGLDLAVAFLGFVGSTVILLRTLARLDSTWVSLRRSQGHEQEEGALSRIVVYAVALALGVFILWYYLFSSAYVMPFMGNGQ